MFGHITPQYVKIMGLDLESRMTTIAASTHRCFSLQGKGGGHFQMDVTPWRQSRIVQRTELKIRDAFFSRKRVLTPYLDRVAEAPLDQLLSERFGPEVGAEGPQRKLYACLVVHKSAGQPWGAPV